MYNLLGVYVKKGFFAVFGRLNLKRVKTESKLSQYWDKSKSRLRQNWEKSEVKLIFILLVKKGFLEVFAPLTPNLKKIIMRAVIHEQIGKSTQQ